MCIQNVITNIYNLVYIYIHTKVLDQSVPFQTSLSNYLSGLSRVPSCPRVIHLLKFGFAGGQIFAVLCDPGQIVTTLFCAPRHVKYWVASSTS